MDADYVGHLAHPVNKTPLRFDASSKQLLDTTGSDKFEIRQNVPVLLNENLSNELASNPLHEKAGTQFSYKEHYRNDAFIFDYNEEISDPIEKEEINRLHQNILSLVPKDSNWILDVGTGNGWLAKNLIPKGKKVISMDISDINPLRSLKNTPSPNHFGLVADAFELPIKKESIDCIVASEIIEHLSDPGIFIKELYNAIKPGGRIIITTPYNEVIRFSQCIHCNQLTPQNAHLHSFTEVTIRKFVPAGISKVSTGVVNNKVLVKLRLQYLLGFLPFPLWKIMDKLANSMVKKAFRLVMVIEK